MDCCRNRCQEISKCRFRSLPYFGRIHLWKKWPKAKNWYDFPRYPTRNCWRRFAFPIFYAKRMDSWNTTKTRWLKSYLEITSWKKILQRKICWRMVTSPLPTRTQQLKELNLKGAHFGQWKKSSLGKIQLSNGPKLFKDKLNHVRSLEKSLNLIKIIKFRMIWISFNLFIFKLFYINRLSEVIDLTNDVKNTTKENSW